MIPRIFSTERFATAEQGTFCDASARSSAALNVEACGGRSMTDKEGVLWR